MFMKKEHEFSSQEKDYIKRKVAYLRQLQGEPSRIILQPVEEKQLAAIKLGLLAKMQQTLSAVEVEPEVKDKYQPSKKEASLKSKNFMSPNLPSPSLSLQEQHKRLENEALKRAQLSSQRRIDEEIARQIEEARDDAAGVGLNRSPIDSFATISSSTIQLGQEGDKLERLFFYVVRGNIHGIEDIICSNREYSTVKYPLTTLAKTAFPPMTLFQYALWSWDKPLWELIRKYLSKKEAVDQIEFLEENLEILNGVGSHYDYEDMFEKYERLVYFFDRGEEGACNSYWLSDIRKTQSHFPAWLIHAVLADEKQYIWSIDNKNFPEHRPLKNIEKWLEFFSDQSEKACFALQRGAKSPAEFVSAPSIAVIKYDIKVLRNKFKAVYHDYQELKTNLNIAPKLRKKTPASKKAVVSSTNEEAKALIKTKGTLFTVSAVEKPILTSAGPRQNMEFYDNKHRKEAGFNDNDIASLKECLRRGNLIELDSLLKRQPKLVYVLESFEDLSNRKFYKISAFQFAVWCRDKPMWELILHYLPLDDAARQIYVLEKELYDLPAKQFYVKHIMTKIDEYVRAHERGFKNLEAPELWCRGIGRAQRDAPPWLIFMWCEEIKKGKKTDQIGWIAQDTSAKYERDMELLTMWFESKKWGGTLGQGWALSRGDWKTYYRSAGVDGGFSLSRIKHDKEMLAKLAVYLEQSMSDLHDRLNVHISPSYQLSNQKF